VRRRWDNPGPLAAGKGVGDRQRHKGLLDVTRPEGFDGGLAPWMRQRTAIAQPPEALASQAAHGAPQPPTIEPWLAAVRRERTLAPHNGADRFIAS
jgi:hypothetical protein